MRMLNTCAVFMCFTHVGIFLCVLHMSLYLYPSQTKFGGGYIRFTLSYCLSVWLPSVNMILSTHVLGNGSIDFSENLYTSAPRIFIFIGYFFSILKAFFLYLDLLVWNIVLKIMKNFDLNIENVLFLNWNFVFTIMIYNIDIWILKICKGGGVKYTL